MKNNYSTTKQNYKCTKTARNKTYNLLLVTPYVLLSCSLSEHVLIMFDSTNNRMDGGMV